MSQNSTNDIDSLDMGGLDTEALARLVPDLGSTKADAAKMARMLELYEAYQNMEKVAGMDRWFKPPFTIDKCPKHKAFFDAGKEYDERLFMAANRVGKTIAGAYETACHLTGLYPEWWEGRRFDHPISAWAAGITHVDTRDIIQHELLGPAHALGTGMVPQELIGRTWTKQGVPGALDTAQVKHVSGGWSSVGFRAYQQGRENFQGQAKHVVWLDEECPHDIYNECLMRTFTVNGIMLVTFTPLKGLTPMVVTFCDAADFLAGAVPITALRSDDDDE